MKSSRKLSPARSEGGRTPRRSRGSRSVDSPSTSISGRIMPHKTTRRLNNVEQLKENQSFVLSPVNGRRSVLSDNTEIVKPRRRSWWTKLGDNSRDVMEVFESRDINIVQDYADVEIPNQEPVEQSIDLPESSDNESIASIVLPPRKLFTQKKNEQQNLFKKAFEKRKSMENLYKTQTESEKTMEINVAPKNLFKKADIPRPRPVFPLALLNLSDTNKTIMDKSKEKTIEIKKQGRTLFGSRAPANNKNMFKDFILSESEGDISDIQPRVFGFNKHSSNQPSKESAPSNFNADHYSPSSSIASDAEVNSWRLLPSSTMVENVGDYETPTKKARLSKEFDKLSHERVKEIGMTKHDSLHNLKQIQPENQNENDKIELLTQDPNTSKAKSKRNLTKNMSTINTNENFSNKEQIHDEFTVVEGNKDISNLVEDDIELSLHYESDDNINNVEECHPEQNNENGGDNTIIEKSYVKDTHDILYDNLERELESIHTHGNDNPNNDLIKNTNLEKSRNNRGISQNCLTKSNETKDEVENDKQVITEHKSDERNSVDLAEVLLGREEQIPNKSILSNQEIQILENPTTLGKGLNFEIEELSVLRSETDDEEMDETKEKDNHLQVIMASNNDSQEQENMEDPNNIKRKEHLDCDGKQITKKLEAEQYSNDQQVELDNQEQSKVEVEDEQESDENRGNSEEQQESEVEQEIEDQVESEDHQESEIEQEIEDQEEYEEQQESEVEEEIEDQVESEDHQESEIEQEIEDQEEYEEQQESEVEKEKENQDLSEEQQESELGEEIENQQVSEEELQYEEQQDSENEHEVENQQDLPKNKQYLQETPVDTSDIIQNSAGKDTAPHNKNKSNKRNTITRNKTSNESNIRSPEAILDNEHNKISLFEVEDRRNTSFRKTKSVIKRFTDLRPSLEPTRDSMRRESDGSTNFSAGGSGWDSHRTTRKTLRQTFGKDFTPRKSLRALVMEKSAKRQIAYNEMQVPNAHSTEINQTSDIDNVDALETHPLESDTTENIGASKKNSSKTVQKTLEEYIQKIQMNNMDMKQTIEEKVKNRLNARSRTANLENVVPIKTVRHNYGIGKSKPNPKESSKKKISLLAPYLPKNFYEDVNYKPPKRYQPTNASWVTKHLYTYLEKKLEPKYDYKARMRAEKFVEMLFQFSTSIKKIDVAPIQAIDNLKQEMARLNIVETHLEFYDFFRTYMPREIRIKVNPDLANQLPLPQGGVFSNIMN